jgi:hypothetical protein
MEFQFEAEFIKDDVCAYVDNIVSFEAYDEFHSVCLFVCLFGFKNKNKNLTFYLFLFLFKNLKI